MIRNRSFVKTWARYAVNLAGLLGLVVLLTPFSVSAFNAGPIASIRRLYQKSLSSDLHKNTIVCNTTLAAIGLQTTAITFFHLPSQANPERDPYLMNYRLYRVLVTYNIAASVRYRTEYLYDGKGQCVFFFRTEETTGGGRKALRLYFSFGSLIRVQRDGSGKQYRRDRRFSSKDRKAAAAALREAGVYFKAFRTTLSLEQTGKGGI